MTALYDKNFTMFLWWPATKIFAQGLTPEAFPKLSRSFPEAFPKLSRSFPEAFPKLSRSFPEAFPKLSRSFPEAFPKLSRSFPKAFPKLFQSSPKAFLRFFKTKAFPKPHPRSLPNSEYFLWLTAHPDLTQTSLVNIVFLAQGLTPGDFSEISRTRFHAQDFRQ